MPYLLRIRSRYIPSLGVICSGRAACACILVALSGFATAQQALGAIQTVAGMPPVVDPANLYSETSAGRMRPDVAKALRRIYVPNRRTNDVTVIDPDSMKVVDRFKVGVHPQHVVPSWDLKTLWVTNNAEGRFDGTLTPIDPMTAKPGKLRSSPADCRFRAQ